MKKRIGERVELEVAYRLKTGSQGLLTEKESRVASYLMFDYNVNDIAKELYRSKETVKMHIRNMKKKCRCETQIKLGAVLQSFMKNNPEGYIQKDVHQPE